MKEKGGRGKDEERGEREKGKGEGKAKGGSRGMAPSLRQDSMRPSKGRDFEILLPSFPSLSPSSSSFVLPSPSFPFRRHSYSPPPHSLFPLRPRTPPLP